MKQSCSICTLHISKKYSLRYGSMPWWFTLTYNIMNIINKTSLSAEPPCKPCMFTQQSYIGTKWPREGVGICSLSTCNLKSINLLSLSPLHLNTIFTRCWRCVVVVLLLFVCVGTMFYICCFFLRSELMFTTFILLMHGEFMQQAPNSFP